ncbi:MAG: hypothetical protein MZV70_59155 [Desulfobacterales bacterium]|nr:hypothetical protein [Desulfobacterales bacterium]
MALRAEDSGVQGDFHPRQDKGAGIQRRRRLRRHQGGERIPDHPGDRERRCPVTGTHREDLRRDGVRRRRHGPGRPRQSLDFPSDRADTWHRGRSSLSPGITERQRVMKDHRSRNIAFHGESRGVIHFRKFFVWYTRGLAVRDLRINVFHEKTGDGNDEDDRRNVPPRRPVVEIDL